MLDLDNDLLWNTKSASHSTPREAREKTTWDVEAYLDFLDDIEGFQSATARKKIFFYNGDFEL